jgi:hypothetical protein
MPIVLNYIRSRKESEELSSAVSVELWLEPGNRLSLPMNSAHRSEGVVQNSSRSLFYKLQMSHRQN